MLLMCAGAVALSVPRHAAGEPAHLAEACAPGLQGVAAEPQSRILAWTAQLSPRRRPTPPVFTCRLDDYSRRFVVGVADAPRLATGVYQLDLAAAPHAGTGAGLDATALATPGVPSLEGVVRDRSGAPHLVFCAVDAAQGEQRRYCELVNLRRIHLTLLYMGATSPRGTGCLDGQARVTLATAGWFTLRITGSRDDAARDVVLAVTEEDCTTHVRRTFMKRFVAADSGFVEAR